MEIEMEWLSNEDKIVLSKMIDFTTKGHDGEYRKGTQLPYIVHPMEVLHQLGDWSIFDLKTWNMALGHDLGESLVSLRNDWSPLVDIIGEDSVDGIKELTFVPDRRDARSDKEQKEEYMKSWLLKNPDGTYVKSVESLVVKVSDRICNVWDFIQTTPDYAPKYLSKASALFDAMRNREQEILEKYGPDSYPLMRHTFGEISTMII